MGPLVQVLFAFLIYYFSVDVDSCFYFYHYFILIFNLLPIYPLDGGKLMNLILSFFISYYQSLKQSFYLSFFFYVCLSFILLFWKRNLVFILVLGLLGVKVYKEIKQADYYFQKFLMERYLKHYSFSKIKKISEIKQMRRDYYHYFLKNNGMISEKEQLTRYFS